MSTAVTEKPDEHAPAPEVSERIEQGEMGSESKAKRLALTDDDLVTDMVSFAYSFVQLLNRESPQVRCERLQF